MVRFYWFQEYLSAPLWGCFTWLKFKDSPPSFAVEPLGFPDEVASYGGLQPRIVI